MDEDIMSIVITNNWRACVDEYYTLFLHILI